MTRPFIGRERELEALDAAWNSPGAQFYVLYGRRRVGKTSLLAHWIKAGGRRALYWVAEPSSALAQLRSFSQSLYNFAFPGQAAPENFTFGTWEQAWAQVEALTKSGRLALFIDEFTYLLETDPSIAGKLQNYWDGHWKDANLFLALSGSHLGMMKREFLSYQAPLYGRASGQIFLQPLPFGATRRYFPGYSAADRVTIYSIFGGIPAYWERIDPGRSLTHNIKSQLLTANNLMQAEPRLLLSDFISNTHNYIAILTAIATGARTPKEISVYTGLPNMHIPKYLSVLSEAGFVERRVPVTEGEGSRAGRHHITDPYLRFYYRFLAQRQQQLALDIPEQSLAEITARLNDFIGTHTWEELCREWLLRAGARGALPLLPDRVGSAWNAAAQVDVAGINRSEKTLVLGECKWTSSPADRKTLAVLVEEKASAIVPSEGHWHVYFLGFSRSGWTDSAVEYARSLEGLRIGGWTCAGSRLLDLEAVDRDLGAWG
jgi:uncharacterized protein